MRFVCPCHGLVTSHYVSECMIATAGDSTVLRRRQRNPLIAHNPGDSAAWSLPSPGGVSVPANARLVTQHASWLIDLGMLHHLRAQAAPA